MADQDETVLSRTLNSLILAIAEFDSQVVNLSQLPDNASLVLEEIIEQLKRATEMANKMGAVELVSRAQNKELRDALKLLKDSQDRNTRLESKIEELITTFGTGGAARTLLEQTAASSATAVADISRLHRDVVPLHRMFPLNSGMIWATVANFWNISESRESGRSTIWGEQHVVRLAQDVLAKGFIRQKFDLGGTHYDNGLYALRAALTPVLRRYGVPLERVDPLMIRKSTAYETEIHNHNARYPGNPEPGRQAADEVKLTVISIKIICMLLGPIIEENATQNQESVRLYPVLFVRSTAYGGYRVLMPTRQNPNSPVTDHIFLGNFGGQGPLGGEDEARVTLSRWDVGPEWSAIAPPGALDRTSPMSDIEKGLAAAREKMEQGIRRVRQRHSNSNLSAREIEELVHSNADLAISDDFRQTLSRTGFSVMSGLSEGHQAPFRRGSETRMSEDDRSEPRNNEAQNPFNTTSMPRTGTFAHLNAAVGSAFNKLKRKSSKDAVTPADSTLPDRTTGIPAVPRIPHNYATGRQTEDAEENELIPPPPEEDIDVLPHYGRGEKIWIGPPSVQPDLQNAGQFDARSKAALTLVKNKPGAGVRRVKEPDQLRRRCFLANQGGLTKCMASYAITTPPHDNTWHNKDGPCGECQGLGRECVVMLSLEMAYKKGTGHG